MSAQQFPKVCRNCGVAHDSESWSQLPLVGSADYDGEVLELRNCACHSTLTIDITPARPLVETLNLRLAVAS